MLTLENYKDNSLYPYKADYENGDEKFSAFAMSEKAFSSKHWIRIYNNPEYKGV